MVTLYTLQAEKEKNPAGSYEALFVVAKGLSKKEEWKLKDTESYSYEVLGGTHLSLATKLMHEKQPNNPHFVGRMCRIYVELSDEQAQCTSFTALNVVRLIIEMFIGEVSI